MDGSPRSARFTAVHRAWLRIGRPLQGWFKGLVVNYEGASTAFSRKALAMAGPGPPDSPMFVSPTRRFSLGEFCGATWAFALDSQARSCDKATSTMKGEQHVYA